jgi:hypothetical protein
MSMGESHEHMRESMESILDLSVDKFCFGFCFGSFFPLFCSPILALSRRLVPPFTFLHVHHLPRIVVWIQYVLIIPSRPHKRTP